MTTLRHTITTTADPDDAWDAIADFGAVHELAAGFVVATEREGDLRVVTFANGVVARERLISTDPSRRRLAYSITESPAALTYHHGSFEVRPTAGPQPGCEVVWTVDLLPPEAAPLIDQMMATGSAAMAATLDRPATRQPARSAESARSARS